MEQAILSKSLQRGFLLLGLICFLPTVGLAKSTFGLASEYLEEHLNTSSRLSLNWDTREFSEEVINSIVKKSNQEFYFENKVYIAEFEYKQKTYLAIIDNVLGKALPITFLVLFDKQAQIITSKVLHYREPYGGGVQNPKWLKQFNGKKQKQEFEVGPQIQGISGATISVYSISKGIYKLHLLASQILKK